MGLKDYEYLKVGGVSSREQIIGLDAYWRDVRFEWSSGKLIYKGVHRVHDIGTDNTKWEIWKVTWDGDDFVRIEGPLPGSWDGKDSLNWGT